MVVYAIRKSFIFFKNMFIFISFLTFTINLFNTHNATIKRNRLVQKSDETKLFYDEVEKEEFLKDIQYFPTEFVISENEEKWYFGTIDFLETMIQEIFINHFI